jgi:hypothetical protein
MQAMLGISLHSYLYLKLEKRYVFLIISCFLFNKIREEEGRTVSAWKGGMSMAQTMYTHVSKCKNGKNGPNETSRDKN